MADIKRTQFLQEIGKGQITESSLFLFYGERYLCQEAADALQKGLMERKGTIHKIDGATEDAGQTLSRLLSYSLLPGLQIYRVSESRIFQSKTIIEKIWKKAARAMRNGRLDAVLRYLTDMAKLGGLSAQSLKGDQVFSEIGKTHWKKFFGFDKPDEDISWADQIMATAPEEQTSSPTDLVDSYIQAFDRGLPAGNILILTAETVDKRQRFFSYCKKSATTIDCSVASGSNSAAQKDQLAVVQEQLNKTLGLFQKKMAADAVRLFIDRVGCHPVAVINEAEKLALYAGDRPKISIDDVRELTSQTREDALFEFTEALSSGQAAKSLIILKRILSNNIHSLAVLATLRNFYRRLLLIRGVQLKHRVPWQQMPAQQFQNSYLPSLKENDEWAELIKGHPFAVYNNFKRAAEYSPNSLKNLLILVHGAEYRVKSSFLPQQLLLEELTIAILRNKKI
ncbi:DNA polymerase III subunit delta [Desulfotalea psychrophila]|uniref:DNA-directed DNA polymerase n=1 Tax=Desulfotalea psychrophila (strain LSv54 / DSM 12343) TaxID=177439 RepID=Q6APV6_DESPS|nr:hypothetical protein [Desulfotalea psychrophila]CAG35617.1 hypothetical protein DP0888 [Desulfotalea psychrophila LSv54]